MIMWSMCSLFQCAILLLYIKLELMQYFGLGSFLLVDHATVIQKIKPSGNVSQKALLITSSASQTLQTSLNILTNFNINHLPMYDNRIELRLLKPSIHLNTV